MAFENVNPQALDAAVNICKNSINYSESQKCIGAISSSTVWQANAKNKLNNALNKLINEKYQKILTYLGTISSASGLISKYKELEEENKEYQKQIYKLEDDLYYEEQERITNIDENGKEIENIRTYTVKNEYVEREIEKLKVKIKENKEEMITLENKVAALID